MKINKWTLGLAAAGVVSLSSVVQAEEAAHQVLTAISATTLSGYVSTSMIWRPGSGTASGAGAYTGAAKQDGFSLDVLNLTVSKGLDEGEWSAGYKGELLFGPDAVGFNTGGVGFGDNMSIKQAYVALRAPVGNGLDFKVGVWDTPIGYEVFNGGDNPNYSRSYGYFLEPTTYTGVLASYKVADAVSIWAGIANTLNAAPNTASVVPANGTPGFIESRKSYMAGMTLTAPDSFGFLAGSTLSAGVINHASGNGAANTINFYTGATVKTGVEGLLAGLAYDHVARGRNGAVIGSSGYANAFAGYLSYQATEKIKTSFRGEYANGSRGTYSAGPGGTFGAIPGQPLGSEQVMAFTATVEYKLWENVLTRLELRWDHDLSAKSDGTLFDTAAGGGAKNLMTIAANLIYKF